MNTEIVDAQGIHRVGISSDGRAIVYEWRCGKCGTHGDRTDDFMGPMRICQCPRASCLAENRVNMQRR